MTIADKAKQALGKPAQVPATMQALKSDGISNLLTMYRGQIAQVLPQHIKADRVIQIVTTVISRTPKLKECNTPSVIGAVLQSAMLGLDPTPELGQCYFIPRWNSKTRAMECQFQIGYQGFINLALNTGAIETVYAYVVHENDEFEFELGLDPKLRHKPAISDRGEMTHAYAVWKMKDGGYYFEVMPREEIMKIKASSEAAQSQYSPWNTFESEMWRKTVIRRSRKYIPLSTEKQKSLVSAMASDDAIITPGNFSPVEKTLDLSTIPEASEAPDDTTEQTGEPEGNNTITGEQIKEIRSNYKVLSAALADDGINSLDDLKKRFGIKSWTASEVTESQYQAVIMYFTEIRVKNERPALDMEG